MYCYNCGKEIADSSKFCPCCGAEQNRRGWHFGKRLRQILLGLIVVPLVILGMLVVFSAFDRDDDVQEPPTTAAAPTAAPTVAPTTEPAEEVTVPEDGWYEENGDRYYFEDGLMYVALQEIDGSLYYFDDDGVLITNEDIEMDGVVLHAGYDGQIDDVTYEAIYGKWAEESYRFGNGGSSSILELSSKVEDCDSFRFYLEANGQHGARVNGNWKVYIRCNGSWVYVDTINYSEPSGYFNISFDRPTSFDAITAYPTVQGNASYSSLFYLTNVHCYF